MNFLGIDTTSRMGSIALCQDDHLIMQEQQGVVGNHTSRLLTSIDHLLRTADWKKNDIDAIAVAIGPGSFTGLRVGLATAKGMAFALNCSLIGISSLKSLAFNARCFTGKVVSIIDARRKEIYAAGYEFKDHSLVKTCLDECVHCPKKLADKLNSWNDNVLLVGDGALAYADIFSTINDRIAIASPSMALPQAYQLIQIARESDEYSDLCALAPNYIRQSDAEIGFKG